MCAGAIVQSRIRRVVIGAMNPKAGCAGQYNLLDDRRFNHRCIIKTRFLKKSAELLSVF